MDWKRGGGFAGGWGAVSRQAEDAGCSRQTAYDHAEKVEAAVRDATGGGPSREQLQQQLRQQAAEIAALKKRLDDATEFPEQEQQRFAATATAMGLSYGQATGTVGNRRQKKCPSRATIARWVKACAEAAGRVLNRLDPACRALVVTGCFDEIFFHGKPVLVGVEPHSMAWVLGEHAADRSGSTWTEALQGFDALEQAVVDGGRGLQRGLADFQAQRKNAGNSTPLEVSLDVFHTKQEAQRVLRKLWNRVESRWARAEEADRQVERGVAQHGGDRRGFGGAAARAWKKVERLMERLRPRGAGVETDRDGVGVVSAGWSFE